jgi:hypothetical protein
MNINYQCKEVFTQLCLNCYGFLPVLIGWSIQQNDDFNEIIDGRIYLYLASWLVAFRVPFLPTRYNKKYER